jgi:hypothetical protein
MRRTPVHCDTSWCRARQRQAFFARCLRALITLALVVCSVAAVAQLSTEDHVAEPGFWPTKSQPSLADFAGKESCARCHAGIARSQQASAMGRTAMLARSAEILRDHPHLRFQYADDTFRIETKAGPGGVTSTYSAEDKTHTSSDPLLWIFGTGRVGQSYLFKKEDGHFYEARVTFFRSLNNIGFTPARSLEHPTDLETAMGRRVETAELIRCFSCHATAVNIADNFNEKGLTAGVTCEACHGPGAAHVQLMQPDGKVAPVHKDSAIFDPSHLSPTESVEFCGACHGSWWDVKLAHVTGPSTTRSAPYRLVTSKCWGKEGDERLKCTACHDPHKDLATDIASYDEACLRCHANGSAAATRAAKVATITTSRAPACPVATSKCASCHMPQVYVPEMQNTFTDHRIRVVHPGEAFQD